MCNAFWFIDRATGKLYPVVTTNLARAIVLAAKLAAEGRVKEPFYYEELGWVYD